MSRIPEDGTNDYSDSGWYQRRWGDLVTLASDNTKTKFENTGFRQGVPFTSMTGEPSFAAGPIYAPDTEWAEKVIAQAETFPKSKFKDLVDSTTQAVTWLRKHGLIAHNIEVAAELREAMEYRSQPKALYDV